MRAYLAIAVSFAPSACGGGEIAAEAALRPNPSASIAPTPAPAIETDRDLGRPSAPARAVTTSGESDSVALTAPAPVGGHWMQCYASFVPRTKPESDVRRLGEACGTVNGMRPLSPPRAATLSEGGRGRDHAWQSKAGECYRIFAVGAPSIGDLDLEVFGPTGARVAFDTSDDRWPVVNPDGSFCAFDAGEYRARVRATVGAGEYAIQIYALARD